LDGKSIPTAIPTDARKPKFTGTFPPASRVMMTDDAKFALGF